MRTNEQATTNKRLRAGEFATLFSEGAEEKIEPPAPARRACPFGAAANRMVARLRALLAPAAPPQGEREPVPAKAYARARSAT